MGLAQSHIWPKVTLCITIAANIADSAILGFDACFPEALLGLFIHLKLGLLGILNILRDYKRKP